MKRICIIRILFLLTLLTLLFLSQVSANTSQVSADTPQEGVNTSRTFVVVNSHSWEDIYLASVYSNFIGTEFLFIKDLSDAELKAQLIDVNEKIILFESKTTPVVKNYASYLSINGYKDVTVTYSDSYLDLQEYLYGKVDSKGLVVISSDFALDAVALTPYLTSNKYFPLFYADSIKKFIASESEKKPTLFVGRLPVRSIEDLPGQKFLGSPAITLSEITNFVSSKVESKWGVLTRIDDIDPSALLSNFPVFVIFDSDYLGNLADNIVNSSITKFEVIGGNSADIATGLESRTGEDLTFMLKFGRRLTNYPGLENTILDIDSVPFDFPVESLNVSKIVYYPKMDILAVTYKNTGNIDVSLYSNIEFSGEVISDDYSPTIPAEETRTVPYNLVVPSHSFSPEAILTTKYGMGIPYVKSLSKNSLFPIYRTNVTVDQHAENASLRLVSQRLDTKKGILYLTFQNPGDESVQFYSNLIIGDDTVLTSKRFKLTPHDKIVSKIALPYVSNADLLNNTFTVRTFYGVADTFFILDSQVTLENSFLTGLVINTAWLSVPVWTIFVLVLILIALILIILWRRKKGNQSLKPQRPSKVLLKKTVKKKVPVKKKIAKKKTKYFKK